MKPIYILRNAVCAAAILTAPAAWADVTAAQVWENWQDSLALYGDDGVTFGEVVESDGQVSVAGVVFSTNDDDAAITSDIGEILFIEQGDGSVSVEMQESYTISIEDLEEGSAFDLAITQENMSIIVSGVPEAMNYDVTADSYEMRVAEFKGNAADFEGDAYVKGHDISGSYQTDMTDGMDTSFDFAASAFDLLIDVKNPENADYVLFSGKMEALATAGQIDLPEGAVMDDPDTFSADFTFAGKSGYGSAGFLFDVNMDGEVSTGSFQTGATSFGGDMNPQTLSYDVSVADTVITVNAPDMPLPVEISLALISSGFAMPVAATDEPAPFAYSVALNDLTVNDEIWAMGDPSGAIPRDPISFVVDLSGMAKLFFDLFDPEQEDAIAFAEVPGEVVSLAVNTIRLSAAGAEVIASGDFTFDNTDLETFNGMPRPEGELNIGITGANALIDTLVSMGLVPQEQATMGRMMMGMFTQPAGDDALTSRIEINEQGHVLANGQRIQ